MNFLLIINFSELLPCANIHLLSRTMSFLESNSVDSGSFPRKHTSYMRFPMSCCISSIVSLSPKIIEMCILRYTYVLVESMYFDKIAQSRHNLPFATA